MKRILQDLRTHSAPDTGAGPQEEPERKKIANRLYVDDNGNEVEIEQATGFKYEFLGRGDQPGDGAAFTRYWRDMSDDEKRMTSFFGAVTLAGNVTNTWLGEKGDKAARACDAIQERFNLLNGGTWIDRSTSAPAKMDLDKLAEAFVEHAESKGAKVDKAKVREQMENKEWAKAARNAPPVAAIYARLMGRESKSFDSLLADVNAS